MASAFVIAAIQRRSEPHFAHSRAPVRNTRFINSAKLYPDVADLLCEAVQFGPLWAGFDRCSGEFEKVTSGSVRLPEAFMAFKVETRRWGLSRAD
jgi:hypothetical protein